MKEISAVMSVGEEKLLEQGVTVDELASMLEELQEHVESIDMANGTRHGQIKATLIWHTHALAHISSGTRVLWNTEDLELICSGICKLWHSLAQVHMWSGSRKHIESLAKRRCDRVKVRAPCGSRRAHTD